MVKVTLELSEDLHKKLKKITTENPKFNSIEACIISILEEEAKEAESYNQKEEEKIKDRLHKIGYF